MEVGGRCSLLLVCTDRTSGLCAPWPGIATVGHPAYTGHRRLDLLFREHRQRHQEPGVRQITEPGCAIDLCALRLQGGNIAVQLAQADNPYTSQRRTAYRAPIAAEQLDEIETPDCHSANHYTRSRIPAPSGCPAGPPYISTSGRRHE